MKKSILLLSIFLGTKAFCMDQATCFKKLSYPFTYNKVDLESKSEGYYVCGEKNKAQFDSLITKGFNTTSTLAATYYSIRLGKFRKTRSLKEDLSNACKYLTSEEINGSSEEEIYQEVLNCRVNSARWAYPAEQGLRNLIGEL